MKKFAAVIPAPVADVAEAYQFSPGVRVGNQIHMSGQLGMNADGSVPETLEAQVENIFGFFDMILKEAGGSLADIFSITSYHLGDLSSQLPVIANIKTRLLGKPHPAWTGIGTNALAVPGCLVEISAIAQLNS